MRETLLKDVNPRPIILGVAAYCVATLFFMALFNMAPESWTHNIAYLWVMALVWTVFVPLFCGFVTGAATDKRLLIVAVYSVISVYLVTLVGFFGQLNSILFYSFLVPLGVYAGWHLRQLKPDVVKRLDRVPLHAGFGVVACWVVVFGGMRWIDYSRQQEYEMSRCAGKPIDENCARKICESKVQERLAAKQMKEYGYSINEAETLHEHSNDADKQGLWTHRGTVRVNQKIDKQEQTSYFLMYCLVNSKGHAWAKLSPTNTENYPAAGTPLRSALETDWRE